jgi:iron complex outermembrane receptor protein
MTLGGGTEEQGFGGFRYGAKIGNDAHYRIYTKYFNRDDAHPAGNEDIGDKWDMWQTGFRIDWEGSARDSFTLQGDVHDLDLGEKNIAPQLRSPYFAVLDMDSEESGANIVSRWKRRFSHSSTMTLKLYYDWYTRDYERIYEEDRHTFDFDMQHRFSLGTRHDVLWGVGYRYSHDDIDNTSLFALDPDSEGEHLVSGFLQDEFTLKENLLRLTLGSKFEHNDYTGFEVQPTARLLYTPNRMNTVWMSISRAVVTPSRTRDGIHVRFDVVAPRSSRNPTRFPFFAIGAGNSDLDSENLVAYEIGYRAQLGSKIALDLAAFYNDYDDLMCSEVGRPFVDISSRPINFGIPAKAVNGMKGETYGLELSIDYQLCDWWQIQAWYSYLQIQLHANSPGSDSGLEAQEGTSPHHQVSFRSMMNLPRDLELDVWFRYVDSLSGTKMGTVINDTIRAGVASYVSLDIRLGWKPREDLELALVGQNLLDKQHPEFSAPLYVNSIPTELERGVYGKITWRF